MSDLIAEFEAAVRADVLAPQDMSHYPAVLRRLGETRIALAEAIVENAILRQHQHDEYGAAKTATVRRGSTDR